MGSTVSVINDFDDGRHIVIGVGPEIYAWVFGEIGGIIAGCLLTMGLATALIPEGVAVVEGGAMAAEGESAALEMAPLATEELADVSGALSEAGQADAFSAPIEAASTEKTVVSGGLISAAAAGQQFYGGLAGLIDVAAAELPGVVSAEELPGVVGDSDPPNRFSTLAKLPISDKSKEVLFLRLINKIIQKKPEDRTDDEKAELKTFDKIATKALAELLKKACNEDKEGDHTNRYSENTVDLAAHESSNWPATLSLVRTAHVLSVNYIDGELNLKKGSKDVWTGGTANSDISYSSKDITMETTTLKDL